MTNKPYKICFLGYRQLSSLARQAIDSLNYSDTEILLVDTNFDTLPEVVNHALSSGCEVFIAGSANAAEFNRHSYEHLIEIHIRTVDYLLAIKKALQIGKAPVIAAYRYSQPIDLELLQELAGIPIELVLYEDSAELYEKLRAAKGDVIIGASFASETADELHKKSVLVYPGEDTIRNTIQRARAMAIELRAEARKNKITQSIIDNAPFGLIVTDEFGAITILNRVARLQTNIGDRRVRGKALADVIPALSTEDFVQSGERQEDRHRLINGAMIRCIQTRIEVGQHMIGVLTTLHPDNVRRKKKGDSTDDLFTARGRWSDVIGNSQAMQAAVQQAKSYADTDYPLIITGEPGTGKSFFAQCIHNGSLRSKEPYVTVNTAAIADQDAGRTLFGAEGPTGTTAGLLEMAHNGTVVLQNLPYSSSVVQSCILQAITEKHFTHVGSNTPIPFQARIISIIPWQNTGHSGIHEELWQRISVLQLTVPPLRHRVEDIMPMCTYYLSQESALPRKRIGSEPAEILQYYSWPGNLAELSSFCKRYTFLLRQTTNPSVSARQLMQIQAIGEEVLFREIMERHPTLSDIANSSSEEILTGIEDMKQILKYNNARIAERLSLSRTTLWRLTKNSETPENAEPAL